MEISGKIKVLKETVTVGTSSFQKRELVITTQEQYPQNLLIEFTQNRCDLLNIFSVGDEVTASIDLRGREWQSPTGEIKYFNSFNGWRITKLGDISTPPPPPSEDDNKYDEPPF